MIVQAEALQTDTQYDWVFIVGSGRCGTTALAQMLGSLPRVAYTPELKYFAYALSSRKRFEPYHSEDAIVRFFIHALGKVIKFNPEFADQENEIVRKFRSRLQHSVLIDAAPVSIYRAVFYELVRTFASSAAASTVILQTPTNLFYDELIYTIVGRVKYIILYRDPRNFFASAMKGSRRWHQKDITAIAHWNLAIQYGERLQARYPDDCVCIRQEDLLVRQEEVLGRLMDFLSISNSERDHITEPSRTNSSFEQEPLSSSNLERYRYTMSAQEIAKVEFLTSKYVPKYYSTKTVSGFTSSLSMLEKLMFSLKYVLETAKLRGVLFLRARGLMAFYFRVKKWVGRRLEAAGATKTR